jgi:hypothetical protein
MSEVKYWPESSQIPLLKATFLSGTLGLEAWTLWKSQINLDDYPDPGSSKLLPQLYRTLKDQGVDDPLMMRLKGIGRKAWYENQRFFESVKEPLKILQQANIKSIILYEPALALKYSNYPLSSVANLALLVPTRQAISAAEILRQSGWVPEKKLLSSSIAAHLNTAYMRNFDDAVGRRIQLHWHLLPECCQLDADEDFWDLAIESQVRDVPVYMLNPADHLLHICAQDTSPAVISPFLRAVDAMFVIKANPRELDWDRLVSQATKRNLGIPVLNTLAFLQEALSDGVPLEVLNQIHSIPVLKSELLEYQLKSHERSIIRRSSRLWYNHNRQLYGAKFPQKVLGFPNYLKHYWQLESLRQVPGHAISSAFNRMRLSG